MEVAPPEMLNMVRRQRSGLRRPHAVDVLQLRQWRRAKSQQHHQLLLLCLVGRGDDEGRAGYQALSPSPHAATRSLGLEPYGNCHPQLWTGVT